MSGVLSCNFSQAANGQTIDHDGVRCHSRNVFPLEMPTSGGMQEEEGCTTNGDSNENGEIETNRAAANDAESDIGNGIRGGWIPAYPGEYPSEDEEEAETTRGLAKPSKPTRKRLRNIAEQVMLNTGVGVRYA